MHNDVVRLADAQQIAGLRAVFGEVYPDPVRVLSIGPAIDALLANPTDRAAWTPFSIEFCGGTHVKNTRDARAFAIIGRFSRCCCCCCWCCCWFKCTVFCGLSKTEETAVSKGIRRLTAVTGLDAQQTIARSQSLLAQIEAFQRDLDLATQPQPQPQESRTSMETITAAISRMEATLSQFRVEIDTQLVLRQVTKTEARERLDMLQRQLLTWKKKAVAAQVDAVLVQVLAEARARVAEGHTTALFTLPITSDAAAIKRTMDEVKKVAPTLSFLCMATGETDKIPVFAVVTETATQQRGLKANEWINATMQQFQGRGGGKPSNAQGTVVVPAAGTVGEVAQQLQQAADAFLLRPRAA